MLPISFISFICKTLSLNLPDSWEWHPHSTENDSRVVYVTQMFSPSMFNYSAPNESMPTRF